MPPLRRRLVLNWDTEIVALSKAGTQWRRATLRLRSETNACWRAETGIRQREEQLPCLEQVPKQKRQVKSISECRDPAERRLAVITVGRTHAEINPEGRSSLSRLIFNRCIFDWSVVRFKPNRRAAPLWTREHALGFRAVFG